MSDSTDGITRLVAQWREGVAEQAQQFDAARSAIDEVSVTETAAGGAIVLTVASSGIPVDLRLGDDVGRMKPDQVASQIMDCLRRAQARLADRVGAVVAATVGDAAGAEAIVEEYQYRFPPPAEVADEPLPPTEENAGFGLPDMDTEPESPAGVPVTSVHEQPAAVTAPAAPARTKPATQARNDDDEDWAASPW